jgi:hypothetical protein
MVRNAFSVALPVSLADGGSHTVQVLAGPAEVPLPAALEFTVDAEHPNQFAGTAFHPIDRQDREPAPSMLATPEATRPAASTDLPASVPAGLPRVQGNTMLRRAPAFRFARMPIRPAWLLGAGCAFYFLLFVYLTRHQGFFQDEWEILLDRRGWNTSAFLTPHVQSLLLIPIFVYKVLFVTVGVHTKWPYRLQGSLCTLCASPACMCWRGGRRALGGRSCRPGSCSSSGPAGRTSYGRCR